MYNQNVWCDHNSRNVDTQYTGYCKNIAGLGVANQSSDYVSSDKNTWGPAEKAIDGNIDTNWKNDCRFRFQFIAYDYI